MAVLARVSDSSAALAVVRGTAVNQDGRSSSLTSPNGPSQSKLIGNALSSGGLAAADVAFLAVHGTGTPLGDPIEIGAIGQALSMRASGRAGAAAGRPAASIGSVKSCYGHTEGAAGLTGVLLAVQAVGHMARPAVMHCRNLNSYVETALSDWGKQHRVSAAIPRQAAAGAAAAGALGGTSSFGMSGVNSHLLLSAPGENSHSPHPDINSLVSPILPWQRSRTWPAAPMHALLPTVAVSGPLVHFTADLHAPALAYSWENLVSGTPVFPAAALLEMASASSFVILDDPQGRNSALVAASMSTVKQLTPQSSASAFLECTVDVTKGTVVVQTGSQLHLKAQFAALPALDAHRLPSLHPVLSCGHVAAVLSQRQRPAFPSVMTASVQTPLNTPLTGYAIHPTAAESTLSLAFTTNHRPSAIKTCGAFQPLTASLSAPQAHHACLSFSPSGANRFSLAVGAMLGSSGVQVSQLEVGFGRGSMPVPEDSPALQLQWKLQQLPTPAAEATSAQKWLILSGEDWPLRSLCAVQPGSAAQVVALNAVYASDSLKAPGREAELVFSDEVQLHLLMGGVVPDHTFVVQSPTPTRSVPGTTLASSHLSNFTYPSPCTNLCNLLV